MTVKGMTMTIKGITMTVKGTTMTVKGITDLPPVNRSRSCVHDYNLTRRLHFAARPLVFFIRVR